MRAKPLRTPKSPTGHTSSRPHWNIKNMCAVHSPMPRTSTSSATTCFVGEPVHAIELHEPAPCPSARSESRWPCFREADPTQLLHRHGEAPLREWAARRRRGEAAVDHRRGPAGELLVADHAGELGEVRAVRTRPMQVGNTVLLQHALQHRVALRERARGFLDFRGNWHARQSAPVVSRPGTRARRRARPRDRRCHRPRGRRGRARAAGSRAHRRRRRGRRGRPRSCTDSPVAAIRPLTDRGAAHRVATRPAPVLPRLGIVGGNTPRCLDTLAATAAAPPARSRGTRRSTDRRGGATRRRGFPPAPPFPRA